MREFARAPYMVISCGVHLRACTRGKEILANLAATVDERVRFLPRAKLPLLPPSLSFVRRPPSGIRFTRVLPFFDRRFEVAFDARKIIATVNTLCVMCYVLASFARSARVTSDV